MYQIKTINNYIQSQNRRFSTGPEVLNNGVIACILYFITWMLVVMKNEIVLPAGTTKWMCYIYTILFLLFFWVDRFSWCLSKHYIDNIFPPLKNYHQLQKCSMVSNSTVNSYESQKTHSVILKMVYKATGTIKGANSGKLAIHIKFTAT